MTGFIERRAQPLPRHFQQAKTGDAPNLDPGAVDFQGFPQPGFNLALIPGDAHVNKINHDQPAQIAQPHLPGDFVGGFQIGSQCGFFDVTALGGAGRVDVHRHQCLGVVNHDPAAGRQADFALIRSFDLRFNLKAGEQRNAVLVGLELAQVVRHDLLDEVLGLPVNRRVIDQNFANVGA